VRSFISSNGLSVERLNSDTLLVEDFRMRHVCKLTSTRGGYISVFVRNNYIPSAKCLGQAERVRIAVKEFYDQCAHVSDA